MEDDLKKIMKPKTIKNKRVVAPLRVTLLFCFLGTFPLKQIFLVRIQDILKTKHPLMKRQILGKHFVSAQSAESLMFEGNTSFKTVHFNLS